MTKGIRQKKTYSRKPSKLFLIRNMKRFLMKRNHKAIF